MIKKLFQLSLLIRIVSICMCQTILAANVEKPEFSFGVIADIQYCDCDDDQVSGRYYRASLEKLSACVQDFNSKKLAFVIQVGDLIDRDFASFDPVLAIYQHLKAPAYHVLGNHDFSVKSEEKSQLAQKFGLKQTYYDFTYNSWRFIVLDGNDLSFYALSKTDEKYSEAETVYQKAKKKNVPNAQTWNGGISAQQFEWLQKTLEKAIQSKEKVILFCHFPIFPPDLHNLWNDSEVVELLQSYKNVVAYIAGHNHAGNYGINNGTHYLTLQGMVQTPDENAYVIIEVYPEYLNVLGYGREPDRMLHISHEK